MNPAPIVAGGRVATTAQAAKVLIVDDVADVLWLLSNLVRQAGMTPLLASSGEEALAQARRESPDLMLLDVGLPDMDGFEVLTRARALDKGVPVIMLTGNGSTHDAVRAIRAGAYDYLTKPFKHEDVMVTVAHALAHRSARRPMRRLPGDAAGAVSLIDTMGGSAAVQRLMREVRQVAPTGFSTLITGETGTGKELVAHAIHDHSPRAGHPLVVVDCGAIPDTLIESELFGHERGAFTGATQAKAGAFEMAGGGTLFLDEIGNLPLAMQAKLLRALDSRRIRRVGSSEEVAVDLRVVAATNVDLHAAVDRQCFRRDLYHRLAEFTINLPPLRRRKQDLAFLVDRFLGAANRELGKHVAGLSDEAWSLIEAYDWPGNVRELRNQLRRAVLLCEDGLDLIGTEGLSLLRGVDEMPVEPAPEADAGCPHEGGAETCPLRRAIGHLADDGGLSLKDVVGAASAQIERSIIQQAIQRADGNKAQCARWLQVDYKTIQSKLKLYEIS